jgi:hypothetical protein
MQHREFDNYCVFFSFERAEKLVELKPSMAWAYGIQSPTNAPPPKALKLKSLQESRKKTCRYLSHGGVFHQLP